MSAPYPDISTVNATTDLSNFLIYANDITDGIFVPGILLSFFIIVALGTFFIQQRVGRERLETSFAAAGFATFGMAGLMSLKTGLLRTDYLIISLVVAIVGAAWLYFSSD